jgi:hypothetical protein
MTIYTLGDPREDEELQRLAVDFGRYFRARIEAELE